jgi:hypothetical protein
MSETVVKTVTVVLNDKDKADYGLQAANHEMAITKLEEDRKVLNTSIRSHRGARHELLKAIETGEEEKTVECKVEKDFDKGEVRYLYEGTVVEARDMEESDRQLDIEDPPPKTKRRGRKSKKTEETQATTH